VTDGSKLAQLKMLREQKFGSAVVKGADTSLREAAPPVPGTPRTGRPLDSKRHLTLKATEPWKKEGMSRRTWFRRQKNAKPARTSPDQDA